MSLVDHNRTQSFVIIDLLYDDIQLIYYVVLFGNVLHYKIKNPISSSSSSSVFFVLICPYILVQIHSMNPLLFCWGGRILKNGGWNFWIINY